MLWGGVEVRKCVGQGAEKGDIVEQMFFLHRIL